MYSAMLTTRYYAVSFSNVMHETLVLTCDHYVTTYKHLQEKISLWNK